MSSFSSKKKTTSTATNTSTPLDQYAPYITQGLTNAQDTLNANQPNLNAMGGKAMDVYNGLSGPQSTLSGIYGGTNPAMSGYSTVQHNAANDSSIPTLTQMAQGSQNPANSILQGMTGGVVNPESQQFYKDTLAGKYLNGNPYLDSIVKQGTDAATKGLNQRFAASGMGEGMSTPYASAMGSSVADANNTLRYGAYKDELGRMGTIGGQSDAQYNATGDRNLAAANGFAASNNADRASQLAAAQALGGQNTADNASTLSATNGSIQSILSALGLSGQLAGDQLGALGASASLPFTGLNQYANLVNGLTGKYGSNTGSSTGTETSTPGVFDWMNMFSRNAAAAAGGGG